MAKKQRSHVLSVRVLFDKSCSSAFALTAAKDCINGEFYLGFGEVTDPEQFSIKSITRQSKRDKAEAT